MRQTVRAYTLSDLNQMTEIWNEVVRAGNAFPQENPLTLKEAEAFFGVCAPTHRLAGRTVPLEELAGERLILREPGSGTRAILEAGLHSRNYTLNHFHGVVTISDFSTIKFLTSDGIGVSFLYAPVVRKELKAGTLARFDLENLPMCGAFYFVCLKDNFLPRIGFRGCLDIL